MTEYIDFYTESELDPLFNNILEVEGFCKVKELSRQLRTFFNYKAEAIQLRFQTSVQTNHFSNNSWTYNTLYAQKQQIESLSYDFISLLKSINRDDTNLEKLV